MIKFCDVILMTFFGDKYVEVATRPNHATSGHKIEG